MELSLLFSRFPDKLVEDFGQLTKDFFCARSVISGTYGGCLFVMEKALVFVSTYLNSRSYDWSIPLKDITMATAFHRRIIPSLEVEWAEGKECFTNFYDLKAIEKTLRDTLPRGKVAVKLSGSPKRLNRMISVPVKSSTPSSATFPKLEPCIFFSKCGFCPRRVVCKFDHTVQTKSSGKSVYKFESGSKIPHHATNSSSVYGSNSSSAYGSTFQRSPAKKAHFQENTKSSGLSKESELFHSSATVELLRSISSPAFVAESEAKSHTGNETEVLNNIVILNSDSESHSSTPKSKFKPFVGELNLPESFKFSPKSSEKVLRTSISEEPGSSSTGKRLSSSQDVFVFSASAPTSPQKKRRNAAVAYSSPQLGVAKGVLQLGLGEGNETVNREVAMLTQQLELASDDDSLHGDLDIEAQMRVMDSYSNGKVNYPEAPPPYSSLSPHFIMPSKSDISTSEEEVMSASEGHSHKRQPCYYFLSGYCRNGTECPDYHGMDSHMDELEFDDLMLVPIPAKIRVHSGVAIGRSDINSGDKIILSPHILMSCEQQELSYPMAFKMENTLLGISVYGGVLQFTSPSADSAYLPQWMMEHLQVQDGDEVSFKHVDLPKGTFVRLQPVSSSWLGIPFDKRMTVMEFQLRNFQTLTEGTKVTLTYELNKYTLKVLECKPAKGISIVDADLTTDIIEPADFNRFHSVEEGQAENIGLDDPKKCSMKSDAYRHFVLLSLPGRPLPSQLRVEVESSKGDADLFLSQTFAAPLQSRYTWCNQDIGKSVILLNAEDEKNYDAHKPLYAGVMAAFEDADFTITFHSEDTADLSKADSASLPIQSGQTLRGNTSSSNGKPDEVTTPTALEPLPVDHQRCSYCGSVMPSLRLLMHERHCAQSTFKCPLCQICLPKAAEKKHSSICHQLLLCECGMEYNQLALHRHQELDCSKRMVHCPFRWCNLSFPLDQLSSHENICGRKKVDCPVCKEEVSHLEMEIHLKAFHEVDTDKIDWKKPLASQELIFKLNESKFHCPCGVGFQFEDDMQVHQLTECAFRRMAEDERGVDESGGSGLLPVNVTSDVVG